MLQENVDIVHDSFHAFAEGGFPAFARNASAKVLTSLRAPSSLMSLAGSRRFAGLCGEKGGQDCRVASTVNTAPPPLPQVSSQAPFMTRRV